MAIRRDGPGPRDPCRGKRVMFGLGPATKIYIAVEGVDMRKGFDGLFGLVRDRLGEDPLSGHLFLFANSSMVYSKHQFSAHPLNTAPIVLFLRWSSTAPPVTADRDVRPRERAQDRFTPVKF